MTLKVCIVNCVSLNGGDAAILYALEKMLRLAFGDALDIVVFDSHAAIAARHHPQFHFRQMHGYARPRWVKALRMRWLHEWFFYRRWSAGIALARWGLPGAGKRLAPGALHEHWHSYEEADLVVSTGGTYLVEQYKLAWRFMHLLTAAALGRPLLLFTQSLGPFRSSRNRAFVRRLLPRVELLLARDQLSARHVAEAKALPRALACSSDGVFALADEQRLRKAAERTWPRSTPRIAVSVRAWKHFSHGDRAAGMERYQQAVAAGITFLVREKSARVTFISTCQGIAEYKVQDSKVAEAICNLLPEDVCQSVVVDHSFRTPDALIAKLSEFDLVVATRMHAAILSLVAGTPALPIAYEFKTKELFDSLGWRDWVLDIESLEGALVVDRLSNLVAALPELRAGLFREVERHRRSALDSSRLMREALERATARRAG